MFYSISGSKSVPQDATRFDPLPLGRGGADGFGIMRRMQETGRDKVYDEIRVQLSRALIGGEVSARLLAYLSFLWPPQSLDSPRTHHV